MTDPRISGVNPTQSQNLRELTNQQILRQVESAEDLQQWSENAFNPLAMTRNFRPLRDLRAPRTEKSEQKEKVIAPIKSVEEIEGIAGRYQRNNRELRTRTLLILRSRIRAGDTSEEILEKVQEVYADYSLADEAIDFLMETGEPVTEAAIQEAKNKLNSRFDREIRSGKNVGAQARAFASAQLGSPGSLREMYFDITHNPREPLQLFEELSERFSYIELVKVIRFLLYALASDLRAKASSISHPELKRLVDEIRSLQGILGIYRFFRERMRSIQKQFVSGDTEFPSSLDFNVLARQFAKLLGEKFPSLDRLLQMARALGMEEDVVAQIIIFTQMREGLKQIAPRYYRTPKQKEELKSLFDELLEQLEDQLDEEEEDG